MNELTRPLLRGKITIDKGQFIRKGILVSSKLPKTNKIFVKNFFQASQMRHIKKNANKFINAT